MVTFLLKKKLVDCLTGTASPMTLLMTLAVRAKNLEIALAFLSDQRDYTISVSRFERQVQELICVTLIHVLTINVE